MSKLTTEIVVDLANLPPLTQGQTAELEAIVAMADDEIDFSDTPMSTDEFWSKAVRNPYLRSGIVATIDIEHEVLVWAPLRRR